MHQKPEYHFVDSRWRRQCSSAFAGSADRNGPRRARVMFSIVLVRYWAIRNKVRVWVAPSTIARHHIRLTCFERPILAIPIHAFAHPEHRAPRSFVVVRSRRLQTNHQKSKSDRSENDPGHLQPPWLITRTNTGHGISSPHRRAAQRRQGPLCGRADVAQTLNDVCF